MNELDRERLQEASGYAARWVEYDAAVRGVPGGVIGVGWNGEVVAIHAFGLANIERGEPMRAEHIFRIASHSKTFTAVAIMQCVEAGRLRLDDTLGNYVNGLPDGVARVTVRQALNHAGGVIRDGKDTDFWQLERSFPDAEQLLATVQDGGPVLPPNDRFKYSNIAFSLLGLVIEAVTGESYASYTRRAIVERLGLRDTGAETDDHARERLVTGYTGVWAGMPRVALEDVPTGAMAAATGFYSTANDLLDYGAAHAFGHEELLSDDAKREMQGAYWATGSGDRYGLGLAVEEIDGLHVVGHGGSFPGHSTRTWIEPAKGLVVTVLLNQSGGPAKEYANGILSLIARAHEAPTVTAAVARALSRYEGRFWGLWGPTDVVRFGGSLLVVNPSTSNPWKDATTLEVVDEDVLRIEEPDGYGSHGEEVRFERDAESVVTRVRISGSSAYPEETFRTQLEGR
jgi:CubicO group peptidase (beta-lactamase class C family)